MKLNRFEIDIELNSQERKDGKIINNKSLITVLGINQQIYQSRLDNITDYTMRLTHRFIINVNDEQLTLISKLDKKNLVKAVVKYPNGSINYAILSLNKKNYNQYVLELGEVL